MPPTATMMGLNMLVGPWEGGHPPVSKCSAVRELDANPRCLSPSCSEPSCNATSGKSQGIEREALRAALPLLGRNQSTQPYVYAWLAFGES